jgi:predicted nucleotidyltransferase
MRQQEIVEKLKKLKSTLKDDFGVDEIILFGSVARDEANENSDIDILVKGDIQNLFVLSNLNLFLEDKLNSKVDIGTYNSIRPFIKKRIEKELIYV